MAIVVPGVATNYPSPLVALASPFGKEPAEGRYQIPVEIDWGSMGGSNFLCSFNLQNSGNTKEISQICAVHVDNSACGADVQFIFTDTSETVTVPAYSNYALVPIFSRSLEFFVQAGIDNEVVEPADVTRFTLFNFVPPPVVIAPSNEQSPGSVSFTNVTGAGTTDLTSATLNGTIESISGIYNGLSIAAGTADFKLVDGTGQNLAWGQVTVANATNYAGIVVFNIPIAAQRFHNGIQLVQSGANIGGQLTLNIAVRTP